MWYRVTLLLFFVSGLWAEKVHLLLKAGKIDERSLALQGMQVLEALGDGEWIVSAESNAAVARLAGPIPVSKKLSEDLRDGNAPMWAQVKMRSGDGLELLVYFHKDVSADTAQWELDRVGAQLVDRSDDFERLTVKVLKEDLPLLVGMDWVRWIEPVFGPSKLSSNAESAALLKVKELQEQFALDGAGATVAVIDDIADRHNEFGERLKQVSTNRPGVHGTHVMGTVGAAGSTDPRLKGMAPAAKLVSLPFNPISVGLSSNLNAKTIEGADLGQNSWNLVVEESLGNCNFFGAYTSLDRDFDRIVFEQKHPIVFSAGNDRSNYDCLMFARAGYYTMVPPANAKNVISVGAIDRSNALSVFSNFGPTKDGRVKPDLVALGISVLSTSTSNRTTTLSGTSMAAPAVSGLSALLIDRYRTKHGKAPGPELLRSILLNTANDLGNPGPDYSYGYGIPDALKAVKVIEDDTWNSESIRSGESKEFEIEVAGGAPSLRVMLAWVDPPATAGRSQQLMNDLDLRLVGPDGQTVRPLVLDPLRPELDAVPGENLRDNVEQVVVNQPAAGKWKMIVSAKDLVVGPQDYSLSWTTAENPRPPCSVTVFPTTLPVPEVATTVSIQVAQSSTCEPWSVADAPAWVSAGEPSNNKASGVVKLRVNPNDSGERRSGVLQVAGRPVTLRQNTRCVAQAITPGTAVNASLVTTDCEAGQGFLAKLYTFEANAGQRLVIEASSRALDAYVILYGPGNLYLAEDDDSGGGLNSRLPATGSLVLPIQGVYTVVMTTAIPSQAGAFTLNVNLGAATGDSGSLPRVISSCPAEQDGALNNRSSRTGRQGDLYNTDVYLFEGRVGQSLRATLAESGFDSVMYLISPAGATLAFDDDSEGRLPLIERTLTANGIYRLEVSSFAPFVSGSYKLRVNGCSEWTAR
jgi:hypothetical protein